MKSLSDTVIDIKKYLLQSDQADTTGVILTYHDVDSYSWAETLEEPEEVAMQELYIPFRSQHRQLLHRVDPQDQDYLVLSHITDIALTLMMQDRKAANTILERYREGAKKTNQKYTTEKRKKAWEKRRKKPKEVI